MAGRMSEVIVDPEYLELTNAVLNELKDVMNAIAEREGKRPEDLFPHYPAWMRKEVQLVKKESEKRK